MDVLLYKQTYTGYAPALNVKYDYLSRLFLSNYSPHPLNPFGW